MEEKCGDAKDGDSEFKKIQCPVCDESHDLDNCNMFKDQTLEKRNKILWKKKVVLWMLFTSVTRSQCKNM